MFEVGEEEETWEEVEGGHEEPSGSGDAPEGGLQMALFSFYPKIPKVRLSFLIPGLALIAEMMRFALVHIHM